MLVKSKCNLLKGYYQYMKKTILVSGASGIVGYGILKSLKKAQEQFTLIGTTIYDFSIAPAFCNVFEKALPTNHPGYMDWLCTIIEKHSVDMIIPGIEPDLFKWNEERTTLNAITFPLLNNNDLINLCRDKWLFYQQLILENKDIAIPTVINGDCTTFPMPVLLKPRSGYGSRGMIKINNEKEFEAYKHKLSTDNYIMQPVIGNEEEEYTVSAFFDKSSKLIDYFPLKRKLSGDGFTLEAQVVDVDFENILLALAKAFAPVGPTNFQFRKHQGAMKLLEINPRISSATSLRSGFGYNESVMSVHYFLDNALPEKLDKKNIVNKRAIRYMEDHIFL